MPRAQTNPLSGKILTLRGHRVVLDADLARLYGVSTSAFNQAIRRNARKFPADFAFQLTTQEYEQILAGELEANSSQFVMSSRGSRRGKTYRPWAFTEHGVVMAANVLRSPKAVTVSVYVVRAFVRMRENLMTNASVLRRLAEIDRTLLEHDSTLRALWERLRPLLAPPPEKPRRPIGFHAG